MLEIKHPSSGQLLKIDQFWLRDHCRCTECYNFTTKQRKYNLLDISPTVKPLELNYHKDGFICEVKWNDGHVSHYDIDFIFESQVQRLIERSKKNVLRTPWNTATIRATQADLHVRLPDLITSDERVNDLVTALIRYGIVFIDEVPPNETMTEMAIRSLFPVMKTFFGEMYTFADTDTTHADTAYTKEYIGPHTDNTYFTDAAGLQALHCIQHENGTGGENFFVDGLHAALQLKQYNPHAFDVLSNVQTSAEYIEDDQHHKHSAPMIRLDPVTKEIIQLRLNIYDRAVFDTIPQEQMQDFYASFREYLKITESKDNQWTLKLKPGTIAIYDNWRIFHARNAYTGVRTMTGCYVQRTDFMSKARILGIID